MVVVIDVVRAATTMCTGLANGAAAFLPVRSVTAARRRAQAIPEGQRLLGASGVECRLRASIWATRP